MKIWKKIACLALCATMSLGTFAACGQENGGGKETEAQRLEKAQASAKKYVQTVSDTLENAKSFHISGKVNAKTTEGFDGEVDEEMQVSLCLDITLTQDGDSFAMQMTAKSEEVEIEFGSIDYSYQMINEAIIKDGYVYSRSYVVSSDMTSEELEATKGLWYKEEITMPEEISSLDINFVNSLLNATEIKELSAKILGGAQEILVEKFFNGDAANGKVAWTKNIAPDINEVVAFIESIDETKDTLGDVLNRTLAEITDNLTIENILAKVKEYKDKTVAQALTEIDAELAKKDTSLQGIYDKIVNSEVVNLLLTQFGMDAESVAQMKAFKIEELKTAYGEMTLGDVVNMIMEMYYGEGEEPIDYASQVIAMLEAALDTTLEELGVEMPDLSMLQVNNMTIDTGLQLNSAGNALEKLYLSVDVDVKETYTGLAIDEDRGMFGYTKFYQYVISADLEIYSFSSSTVVINAPAADQVETDY